MRPVGTVSSRILYMALNGRLSSLVRPSQFYVQIFESRRGHITEISLYRFFSTVKTNLSWSFMGTTSLLNMIFEFQKFEKKEEEEKSAFPLLVDTLCNILRGSDFSSAVFHTSS